MSVSSQTLLYSCENINQQINQFIFAFKVLVNMWLFKDEDDDVILCQLAHGSPIGIIDKFSNILELYSKISKCYDINIYDILYCTLNTHKCDFSKMILQAPEQTKRGIIFAHKKGNPKVVEITKLKNILGATICSNGNGYCIIKSIEPGSDLHATPQIRVGDCIEEINGINVRGKNVESVTLMLKAFQAGSVFTMKLVEPLRAAY